jgi:hypothetical protein
LRSYFSSSAFWNSGVTERSASIKARANRLPGCAMSITNAPFANV